ncbi:MAG: peptidylprolyl isomerase, partial [Brevundimonas aurantiaca]
MIFRKTLIAAGLAALLTGAAQAQEAAAPPPPPGPTEWRAVAPDNLLVIDTTKGRILVELAPEIAPAHVERIKLLASRGFYDNLAW